VAALMLLESVSGIQAKKKVMGLNNITYMLFLFSRSCSGMFFLLTNTTGTWFLSEGTF